MEETLRARFSLRALARAFFVCYIDFFYLFPRFSAKRKKSIKQTKNTPTNVYNGNKPKRLH